MNKKAAAHKRKISKIKRDLVTLDKCEKVLSRCSKDAEKMGILFIKQFIDKAHHACALVRSSLSGELWVLKYNK